MQIACNNDPLRGGFRVQYRPPLTFCVSVLPLALTGREGLMGMIGVDLIGEIRRAYFEQHRPIKEIVRTLSVSRATVRKVDPQRQTEFKYERDVQPTPKLGEWVEVLTEILEKEAKLPSGSAVRRSACSRSCADAAMTAPTTACIGSSRLGATSAPGFQPRPMCR